MKNHPEILIGETMFQKAKKIVRNPKIVLQRISNEIIQSYQMEILPTFSLQDVFDEEIDDFGIFEVNNADQDFDLEIKNVRVLSESEWNFLLK